MEFQIFRVEKVKAAGLLKASARHISREKMPGNADPSRSAENAFANGLAQTADQAMAMWREDLPENVRKDAVVATEVLVSASPGWFEHADRETQNAYFSDGLNWLAERHGRENIIMASIHRDESSPHMHVLITPKRTTENQGREILSHKHFYGGDRGKLSKVQTQFHQEVASRYGLERGIEKTGARHRDVREFYTTVNQLARSTNQLTQDSLPDKKELKELREPGESKELTIYKAAYRKASAAKNEGLLNSYNSLRQQPLHQEVTALRKENRGLRQVVKSTKGELAEAQKLIKSEFDLRNRYGEVTERLAFKIKEIAEEKDPKKAQKIAGQEFRRIVDADPAPAGTRRIADLARQEAFERANEAARASQERSRARRALGRDQDRGGR
jgi:hypothetical protein